MWLKAGPGKSFFNLDLRMNSRGISVVGKVKVKQAPKSHLKLAVRLENGDESQ